MVARPGFADRSTVDAAMTGPDAAAPGAEPHAGVLFAFAVGVGGLLDTPFPLHVPPSTTEPSLVQGRSHCRSFPPIYRSYHMSL